MTIVYATTGLPYTTQEAFVIPEILALSCRGHDVLVAPRSPVGDFVHDDALPLLEKTLRQPLMSWKIIRAAWAEIWRSPYRAAMALGLVLRSRNPRILFKNLAVYPKGLWLARMARERGATHIHAHWAAATSTMAVVASVVSEIPWSLTAHRFDIVENNLLAAKVKRASFVRFISQSGLEMAKGLGISGLAEKARVIHMGVPLPCLKGKDCSQGRPPVILCPANLVPVKGHKYLLEALAILKLRQITASLWIAGHGELRAPLEKQAGELGLTSQVIFLGQLSHTRLLDLYEKAKIDIVVLPSVDLGNGLHEGIPVSLAEAMSYGVPVVSTLTGGIPELLQGEAGLMVPPQDAPALANAIQLLITDTAFRSQLGMAGRKRIEEQFTMDRLLEELSHHLGRVPSNFASGESEGSSGGFSETAHGLTLASASSAPVPAERDGVFRCVRPVQ